MRRTLLRGARLLDPESGRDEPGSLLLEAGRIAARLRPEAAGPEDAEPVDLGGRWLAPGFLDLHHHGRVIFASRDELPSALRHDATELLRHGTTGFLVTTVALPRGDLLGTVEAVAQSLSGGGAGAQASTLGLHLEGPWIAGGAAGAHLPEGIRPYARAEGGELWAAAAGVLRMVTFAPELAGAEELLAELVRRGVVPALGHSTASAAEVEAAIERGARHVTHLFNAMGALHHRAPGLAGAALADDRLTCDLICDGAHVDPRLTRVAARSKRERLVLITDRLDPPRDRGWPLAAGGLRDDGVAFRREDGRLSGSRLTLDRALANARAMAGMTRVEAIAACTLAPARVLGLERERGTLREGARADLVVLDEADRVRETWLAGRRVYDAASDPVGDATGP
jgi:N-acetylglucosamine-6-phosphate deacetylase